jgi:hypothetical protein
MWKIHIRMSRLSDSELLQKLLIPRPDGKYFTGTNDVGAIDLLVGLAQTMHGADNKDEKMETNFQFWPS